MSPFTEYRCLIYTA